MLSLVGQVEQIFIVTINLSPIPYSLSTTPYPLSPIPYSLLPISLLPSV
ncbi:MAG: hypothetical protein LBP59_09120 [Planctomycetaceae bacterium]|nr:hypothetical protein [Planctomycetaceae bacterium]